MKQVRRTVVVLGCLSLGGASVAVGCGDDDTAPAAFDGGIGVGLDATVTPFDANAEDTAPPTRDSGIDADADAGSGADADSGVDAGVDSGSDAGTPNALFAHIDQTLVSADPTTGAITSVGPTGQTWIVLAWDSVAKVARVVLDPYSPAGGAATPKLGTIDLCTGTVTAGPAITVGGVQVRRAEGLIQEPGTGKFFLAYGTNGNNATTEFVSEKSGTIDVGTGAVTANGSHTTLQNDGDNLVFIGSTLKLLDVATANNNGALYVLDKATGAASSPITTGPTVLRVAYDPTRDVVFTAAGTGAEPSVSARAIGTLNRTTGANTSLGTTLATNEHPGHNFSGLLSAPKPVCP